MLRPVYSRSQGGLLAGTKPVSKKPPRPRCRHGTAQHATPRHSTPENGVPCGCRFHDWSMSRRVVEDVWTPVFLGPDNVDDAIRAVRPAGVDSKTKTDRDGSHGTPRTSTASDDFIRPLMPIDLDGLIGAASRRRRLPPPYRSVGSTSAPNSSTVATGSAARLTVNMTRRSPAACATAIWTRHSSGVP